MWVFWLLAAVSVAIYGAMMVLTVPVLLQEADGLKPFDFRPFGYSMSDVQAYLSVLSEEGVATYLGLQHQLDLIYPVVLAAMFVVGFRRWLGPIAGMVMSVVAIAGAIADYSENAVVTSLLTGPATPEQVTLASALTIFKSLVATVCFCALIWIAVREWRSRPKPKKKKKLAQKGRARKTGKS